jgi:uncharacterized protein
MARIGPMRAEGAVTGRRPGTGPRGQVSRPTLRPQSAALAVAVVVAAALAGCGRPPAVVEEAPAVGGASASLIDRAAGVLTGPTVTWTPSPMPSVTATPTATATAIPRLSVEFMRQQQYPGSPLTIEKTLAPGANYRRYIASYLSEGLKIYGLLTVPNGERPATGWPVIVFNHGYIPPQQYRTTERYVAYVDGFARNGYIVFKSDYRGHGDSAGQAAGAYWSPDYTIDVLNAVASLKQYPDADPARMGMWGHSMGGSITLRTMVTTRDIKAGVIWAGVVAPLTDLLQQWHHPGVARPEPTRPSRGGRGREQLTAVYGSPQANPTLWASVSPNTYVADVSGPIQLHHGTGDQEVPYAFSQTLKAELDAAGRNAELYTYPGDNHNLSASFSTAMQRSVAFFDQYVKGAGKAQP